MKRNNVIFWAATIFLFLFEGLMPLGTLLFKPEYATLGTKPLGYPDYFAYSLIIFKILGVIAITVPKVPGKLKEWAYAGLTFNLIFAFISHCAVDKNIVYIIMPIVVGIILAVSYIYKDKLSNSNKQ